MWLNSDRESGLTLTGRGGERREWFNSDRERRRGWFNSDRESGLTETERGESGLTVTGRG